MVLPKEINFPTAPFGIVTIQPGQLDYKKLTRIRLRRGKDGLIYFLIKGGKKYVEDREISTKFHLKL